MIMAGCRPAMFALATLAVALAGPAAQAQQARPVQVGGDGTMDACSGIGQVTGLRPGGDGFLSVRAGPDASRAEVDRLGAGTQLHLCDADGAWLGVVYADDESADCGVTSPVPGRSAYAGPCRSGWVHSRFVNIVAG